MHTATSRVPIRTGVSGGQRVIKYHNQKENDGTPYVHVYIYTYAES